MRQPVRTAVASCIPDIGQSYPLGVSNVDDQKARDEYGHRRGLHLGDGRCAAESVDSMLARMQTLNDACRGRNQQCDQRDALYEKLKAAGMCWGRPGEAEYQKKWHRCAETHRRPTVGDITEWSNGEAQQTETKCWRVGAEMRCETRNTSGQWQPSKTRVCWRVGAEVQCETRNY